MFFRPKLFKIIAFFLEDIKSSYSPLSSSSSVQRDHDFVTSETQFVAPTGQSHSPALSRPMVLSVSTKLYSAAGLRPHRRTIYSTQNLHWPRESFLGWFWLPCSLGHSLLRNRRSVTVVTAGIQKCILTWDDSIQFKSSNVISLGSISILSSHVHSRFPT